MKNYAYVPSLHYFNYLTTIQLIVLDSDLLSVLLAKVSLIDYSYPTAQNDGAWGKTFANRSIQSFGEENIGEFNIYQ